MSKEKEQKKTINSVQIVGTLVETGNLKYDADAENKKTKAKGAIVRADYKKPAFVIDVNGQKIGVSPMPTYKTKLDKDGKTVDNPQFKGLEKNMDLEVGTRVIVKGSISVGDPYAGKNGVIEPVSINMYSMSSTSVPNEDMAEGKASGFIKDIKAETKGEDEEETGRLNVDFWLYDDYNDVVKPFPLVVDEDIAEGFEETYEGGESAILCFDILVRTVGGKKGKSAGFGRKESKIVGGFERIEYSIFDGEDALDDESPYYIDEDDFKVMFKAHKQKCEEAKNAEKNDEKSSKKKGLGSSRKSKVVDDDYDDVDDDPFE